MHDWKKTIYYYSPPFMCLMCFYAYSTMPCYAEQHGLVILMINYAMADITLNLMLHNMAKKPFTFFQTNVFILLLPIVAYYTVGLSVEMERMIPKIICPLAWILFMTKMSILSTQWCDFSQKPFWYIPKAALEAAKKAN